MTVLIPYDLVTLDGHLFVHWLNPDALDLRPAFFREALHALPEKHRFAALTPFEMLLNAVFPSVQAGGLIFHTSRCGSTLVCQMLKQHPEVLVLGEPGLLNRIVQNQVLSRQQKIWALRQSIGLFTHWAREQGQRLIIKLSSWNVLHLNLYREAVTCPTLCQYRHYLPVLESLLGKPPAWLSADWLPPMFVHTDVGRGSMQVIQQQGMAPFYNLLIRAGDSYLQFIAAINAELARNSDIRVLGYESVLSNLAALLTFFNVPISKEVINDMENVARLDAKSGAVFTPREISDDIQRLEATLKKNDPKQIERLAAAYTGLQIRPRQLHAALTGFKMIF